MGPLLALSLAGLDWDGARASGDVRELIAWAAGRGLRAVQLDATTVKARELDRSGRRDLAAMLRRHESAFSGLDLWIPPSHYARADMVDRAIGALLGAIDLAGDLATLVGGVSRAVVSVEFPAQADAAALDAARARADVRGTIVADHAWPTRLAQENSGTQVVREGGAILVGLDPAAVLAAGDEPATAASRLGNLVGSARLSDLSAVGRVAPGEGRLDLPAYRIALETAGYTAPVVLDLRGVARGAERIEDIMHRWHW